MPVSSRWLEYPGIKRVIAYLAAKNGGYEYLSKVSLLTGYVEPIYYFCKFLGYGDPEALLSDIKSGKLDIVAAIQDWRMYLIERGRAPSTISRYHNGVKRWLMVNRVKIDWDEVDVSVPLPKYRSVVEDRIPRLDELRRLINSASLKMKVIIELATSTGMRAGSLINLRVEDLDFNKDDRVLVIKVRPNYSKTRIGYYTLATDEARVILEDYLNRYDIREGWLFPAKSESGHMTYNALQLAWTRLLRKTGLDMKSMGIYVLHFHTLRKWFRTRLEGYLTRSQIEYLMGHLRKEYLDGSYFRPPNEELIRSYKSVMYRLYILKSPEPSYEDVRKRTLLDMARLLGFSDEVIRKIESQLQYRSVDEVIEKIRKFRTI